MLQEWNSSSYSSVVTTLPVETEDPRVVPVGVEEIYYRAVASGVGVVVIEHVSM